MRCRTVKWRIRLERTFTEECEVEVVAPDEESAYDAAWDVAARGGWRTIRVHDSRYDVEALEKEV